MMEKEAIERWENSNGFEYSFADDCTTTDFQAIYALASAYMNIVEKASPELRAKAESRKRSLVDEAWLREMGFRRNASKCYQIETPMSDILERGLEIELEHDEEFWEVNSYTKFSPADTAYVTIAKFTTRRQLRLLLEALGIETGGKK